MVVGEMMRDNPNSPALQMCGDLLNKKLGPPPSIDEFVTCSSKPTRLRPKRGKGRARIGGRAAMPDGLRELQLYLRDSGRFDGLIARRGSLRRDLRRTPPAPRSARLRRRPGHAADRRRLCRLGRILARPGGLHQGLRFGRGGNGSGFFHGEPKILFEPHRFSKLTGRRFDASHPHVSYPRWGMRPYPGTQAGRYEQLLEAIALDPRAAFRACSYGKFQILGENAAACGFPGEPWLFAFAQAGTRSSSCARSRTSSLDRHHHSAAPRAIGARSPAVTTARPTPRTNMT
jgi:hypothetical protein